MPRACAGGGCRAAARRRMQGCALKPGDGEDAETCRPDVGGLLPCGDQPAAGKRPCSSAPKEVVPGANARMSPPVRAVIPVVFISIIRDLLSGLQTRFVTLARSAADVK